MTVDQEAEGLRAARALKVSTREGSLEWCAAEEGWRETEEAREGEKGPEVEADGGEAHWHGQK